LIQVGVGGDYAGFHCSWCSSPEAISIKLRSAIHQDFPRWGDYPEKLDLAYIAGLIKNGGLKSLGSMLGSQFFAIFANFLQKIWRFSKNQCHDHVFAKNRSSLSSS
jgi:hypothetical protein